jgi:glycosyltransferase involved in cell wall biosynthesis
MRVLYFTRGYTAHDHRFLAKLARSGNEIGYLRLSPPGAGDDPHALPEGVRPIELRRHSGGVHPWHVPRLARWLRAVLDAFRPDVVHAGPVQDCALLAAYAGAIPLVSMSWGSDILMGARRGWGRLAARRTLARTAVFVCDCQAVRTAGMALGAPEDRIVVFPWGVDLRHFSPGDGSVLRRRLGWESRLVLISTRTWERAYGIDTLVDGFVRAAARLPSLRLLMLSTGSRAPALRRRLEAAGMLDRVHFAGPISLEDLPAFYRAADIYLTASLSDGSSVSLLEAMACGLPAVASDIPGNREWVGEANGWRFPAGDAAALESLLTRLPAERERLPSLGRQARAIAESRADWDANFPRLLEAYRLAVAAGGAA